LTALISEFCYYAATADLATELREILDYWNRRCGMRDMPSRHDIDPLELRNHLPYLSLVDVLDGGRDFRFRLIGTGITARFGRDSTGKTVREIYATTAPQVLPWVLDSMKSVVDTKQPVIMRGVLRAVQKDFMPFEVLRMPLSECGEAVSMLFCRARFITQPFSSRTSSSTHRRSNPS
jgi:hypothetical protein